MVEAETNSSKPSARRSSEQWQGWLKCLVFLVALVPFFLLVEKTFTDELGADPVETLTKSTGIWTLKFLLITLAMTPIKRLLGVAWPMKLRRMLGLFCFFYATLHLGVYLIFDHDFDWAAILKDVVKRPYITAGFSAFVILLLLAVTSSKAMMKRLGKRWKSLHQWVYGAGILGCLHYLWLVKRDITNPALYMIGLLVLLSMRLFKRPRDSR